MYTEHRKRKAINLWVKLQVNMKTKPTKRLPGNSDDAPPAKWSSMYDSHLQKMSELEEILDKLKFKHKESKYTPEQFHCWANLIQIKKHDLYEAHQNKPFFGKQQPESNGTVSSPGKHIQLRTQCIDQLTKWHKLFEDGVISNENQMHRTIVSDIKKF